ncbi:MAG TPA: M56 family metallopeptidase [Rhizomicrobium sp.]|jgi:beta-lactamase regulating signal transducer with metallopeptidase domain
MSDFGVMRFAMAAAELFVGSSLILALAWLASFRKSASARHLVWTTAFAALLLLPVLFALVPGRFVLSLPAPQTVSLQDTDVAALPALLPGRASEQPVAQPAEQPFQFDAATITLALVALWIIGVLAIAARSAIAALLLRTLHRDSTASPFEEAELPELASGRCYELRVSNVERGPVTWGFIRPVILLPRKSLFWPCERLQAVLRHELAHIHRRDSLTQMLSVIACALYWPNPLVWVGTRLMRREAEMAADDAVIVSGMTPSEYAGELLQVAVEFRAQAMSASLYMAAPSALETRLKSILASTQKRSGVTSMDVLKFAGIALLATSALVLARPSLAQDAPQPPAAVADVPPPPAPPPVADAAPMPPAPPPVVAAPMMAAPPVPPVPPTSVKRHVFVVTNDDDGDATVHVERHAHDAHGHHVRIVIDGKDADIDQGDIDQAIASAQPEIDRAMADVHARMIALHDAEPQIEKALADARAQLAKISDKKVRAEIEQALANAQAKIEAAHVRIVSRHIERTEHADQSGRHVEETEQDVPDDK